MNEKDPKFELSEQIKKLVIARIEASMSPEMRLSIGMGDRLDSEMLIKHVNEGDDIGKQIAEAHLSFLRAQSSGELTKALNTL